MGGHLLLVGMMGTGKSTVAPLVASHLGLSSTDTDAEVETTTSSSVADLFSAAGEEGFRAEETHALRSAVSASAPTVISVGGGAVLDEENRRIMKDAGMVTWLRARPETIAGRVGDGAGRPLLGGDVLERLRTLETARAAFYREVADVVVDTDGLTPEEVAGRVVALWRETSARSSTEAPAK